MNKKNMSGLHTRAYLCYASLRPVVVVGAARGFVSSRLATHIVTHSAVLLCFYAQPSHMAVLYTMIV